MGKIRLTILFSLIYGAWSGVQASSAYLAASDGLIGGDHTLVIKKFLERPEDTLYIQPKPGGWFTGPIKWTSSGKTLILLPTVEWRALAGAYPGKGDCLLTIELARKITILGYGARLCMRKSEYKDGEWRHAISLRGSSDILIEGLQIDSSGGDGIYVAGRRHVKFSSGVVIRNCRLKGHRRQGISVISVQDFLLENSILEETSGTNPESGLDFEPNKPEDRIAGCRVRNVWVRGNRGPAAVIYLRHLNAFSEPSSIDFQDCRFSGTGSGRSFQIMDTPMDSGKGHISYQRCVFENTDGPVLMIRNKGAGTTRLEFQDCVFASSDTRKTEPSAPVVTLFRNRDPAGSREMGGIVFKNCSVRAQGAPLLAFDLGKWPEISGIDLEFHLSGGVISSPIRPGISFASLKAAPVQSLPPPMFGAFSSVGNSWEMRVLSSSSDSIECRIGGKRRVYPSGAKLKLAAGEKVEMVMIRGNNRSETKSWQAPEYLR